MKFHDIKVELFKDYLSSVYTQPLHNSSINDDFPDILLSICNLYITITDIFKTS